MGIGQKPSVSRPSCNDLHASTSRHSYKTMKRKHRKCPRRSPKPRNRSRRTTRRGRRAASPKKCSGTNKTSSSLKALAPAPPKQPLSLEQVCRDLGLSDSALLDLIALVFFLAFRSPHPEAQDVAIDALGKALRSYKPDLASGLSLSHWVRKIVDYALRTLHGQHPSSKIRDAFVDFEQRRGFKPTLIELARFAKQDIRAVVNVMQEIANELQISPAQNTLRLSLLELMGMLSFDALNAEAPAIGMIRNGLAKLQPTDACLLILKHVCLYSEKEILDIIQSARDTYDLTDSADAVEDLLDQRTADRGSDIAAPWDFDLFGIRTRGHLAIRLFRARKRLYELLQ